MMWSSKPTLAIADVTEANANSITPAAKRSVTDRTAEVPPTARQNRRNPRPRYLLAPQLPLLVQAVDEARGQPDVVPDHGFVVRQAVDAADAPAQVSVHHRGQLAVSKLQGAESESGRHWEQPAAVGGGGGSPEYSAGSSRSP